MARSAEITGQQIQTDVADTEAINWLRASGRQGVNTTPSSNGYKFSPIYFL